jgi:hypothetical protein
MRKFDREMLRHFNALLDPLASVDIKSDDERIPLYIDVSREFPLRISSVGNEVENAVAARLCAGGGRHEP